MVPRVRPKCQSTGKTEKRESVKVNENHTKTCLPSKTRSAWPRAGARDSLLVRTHWTIPALRESFFEEIKSLYRNSFLFAFRRHHLGCLFQHLRQWHIDSPLLRSLLLSAFRQPQSSSDLTNTNLPTCSPSLCGVFQSSPSLNQNRKTLLIMIVLHRFTFFTVSCDHDQFEQTFEAALFAWLILALFWPKGISWLR